MSARRGLSVALLGIDNAGKSTLARALHEEISHRGIVSKLVGWRDYLATPTDRTCPYPRRDLEQLWVQKWSLLVGGSCSPSGAPTQIPRTFKEFWEGKEELMLNGAALEGVHASGPAAAAWLELAATVLLQAEHIEPQLRAGSIIIQESFGFKQAVKELIMARELSSAGHFDTSLTEHIDTLMMIFGSKFLQPDIGVFVQCPPRLACSWRMGQSGEFGILEDLTVAGQKGEAGFLRLQEACDQVFEAAARRWGWSILQVDGRPLAEAVRFGLDHVLSSQRLRAWLE